MKICGFGRAAPPACRTELQTLAAPAAAALGGVPAAPRDTRKRFGPLGRRGNSARPVFRNLGEEEEEVLLSPPKSIAALASPTVLALLRSGALAGALALSLACPPSLIESRAAPARAARSSSVPVAAMDAVFVVVAVGEPSPRAGRRRATSRAWRSHEYRPRLSLHTRGCVFVLNTCPCV